MSEFRDCPAGRAPCAGGGHFVTGIPLRVGHFVTGIPLRVVLPMVAREIRSYLIRKRWRIKVQDF